MNQMQMLMNLLQSNPNNIKQMYGNNPIFQRALQMGEGKSEEELKIIIRNLANQRGIDIDQLNMFLNPMGVKL